jgi:hypothetical protein
MVQHVTRANTIEAAKEAVPVIDLADLLIGPGQMRRVGKEWVARCPLPDHEDRVPSFSVSTEENLWYCHGCVRGGDVVRAVVLLDYFKEHARSVHAVLRGEDKKLLLLEDLSAFLRHHGAKWEGEMHQLREELAAREAPRVKPPPNVLSRRINEFAADPRTRIEVEDGTRFDAEKGQGRRVVKITLRNIVDMVDIVDGEERG